MAKFRRSNQSTAIAASFMIMCSAMPGTGYVPPAAATFMHGLEIAERLWQMCSPHLDVSAASTETN